MALHEGPHGPSGQYPEEPTVKSRNQRQQKAMIRAGIVTAGVLVAAILGLNWFRRRA
jgi:hypothetical protein